ncbi:uncharacterized protein GGS22DRAFT_195426 [Annulohypoxylon maeteangense]|uniref:uncharacterized protein n=1 Tax=Annulohypoxylon maeteangense TaxID=1927788 RepID=UPI0020086A74|nr:uncharacterized protein GGS22DRAFT_195426 [Annulohypoxylon maeteangense]KAI0883223.1 hypothetical protein GGS22DRAFT_195426 [Annulohypoxylon maeteangense]
MANAVKNYFLAPSWDYSPNAKPGVTIALWSLVSSPTRMVPPLMAATAVPNDEDINKSTKHGFEWIQEREKENKFGVWTMFLNQLVSIGLGHKHTTSIHDYYTFDNIHTKEAFPSREYVEEMVKTEPVKKYLQWTDFKKPVYLVVGTKAVNGTTIKQLMKKENSTDVKFPVDLISSGTPVSQGPELEISGKNGATLKFDGSDDFVFAFRIRKIVVSQKFEVEDEDDAEGGVLGIVRQKDWDVEVQGIEDHDADDIPASGKKVIVEEDGEHVYVTLL